MEDVLRSLHYAKNFYFERLGILVIFSIPFILAFVVLALVPAPTYLSIGAVFLRTGSLPDLSILDIILTVLAYGISFYIIADTLVNVNLIIRSKRTHTNIKSEIMKAAGSYALRVFYIYTIFLLASFVVGILLNQTSFGNWLLPIFNLALSFVTFFVTPAVVIDNLNTPQAIKKSFEMSIRKPHMIAVWTILGFVALSILKLVFGFVLPVYSEILVLVINSLLILPFLTTLQTQMYMEKYPLAK